MWRPRLVGIACAVAVIALAACSGGGTSSVTPSLQPGGTAPQSTSRLMATSAPDQQIRNIQAHAASVKRTPPPNPFANWVFLEPLAVTDTAAVSVPPWVTKCASIDPIFGGLWYLSLSNFTVPLQAVTIPSCTLPASLTSEAVAGAFHPDAIVPSGNGNIYIVEVDVGLISLTTTPVAGPALGTGATFLFGPDESSFIIQKYHVYAFFVAAYTGTGSPPTVSI